MHVRVELPVPGNPFAIFLGGNGTCVTQYAIHVVACSGRINMLNIVCLRRFYSFYVVPLSETSSHPSSNEYHTASFLHGALPRGKGGIYRQRYAAMLCSRGYDRSRSIINVPLMPHCRTFSGASDGVVLHGWEPPSRGGRSSLRTRFRGGLGLSVFGYGEHDSVLPGACRSSMNVSGHARPLRCMLRCS